MICDGITLIASEEQEIAELVNRVKIKLLKNQDFLCINAAD